MHRDNWFLTLTYDDEHVPKDQSLDYSHVQTLFRSLRQKLRRLHPDKDDPRRKFRFFCAGEYGSRTHRPHYHAIVFGLALPDLRYLKRSPSGNTLFQSDWLSAAWGLGFTSVGAVSFESAAYVASYVCKKATGPDAEKTYCRVDLETGSISTVKPEFAHMSLKPGLGADWFDKYASDVLPRDYCVVDGRKIPVPRFYFERFKALNPFVADELEHDRVLKRNPDDSTPERLKARGTVALAAQALKIRKL